MFSDNELEDTNVTTWNYSHLLKSVVNLQSLIWRPPSLSVFISHHQGKRTSLKQLLLIAGTVSYATCAGVCVTWWCWRQLFSVSYRLYNLQKFLMYLLFQALPQIFINRLGVRSAPVQTFFRSILPIPLSGKLFILKLTIL